MQTGVKGLHPAAAFLFFSVAFAAGMTATHPLTLGLCLTAALALDLRLRGRRAAAFFLKLTLPLAALIPAFNGIFSHYGVTPLFTLPGGNRFTLEAVLFGAVFGLRAAAALTWLNCFNEVVTPEKFIRLFGRVSPKTALILSMALRFLPLLQSQATQINAAQTGCGARGAGVFGRLRDAGRRFSILLSWLLEKGVDTADAMRARGYGLPGRRSYAPFRPTPADAACAALSLAGLAAYIYLHVTMRASYNPVIEIPVPGALQSAAAILTAGALLFPLILDITEKNKWKRLASGR